MEPSHNDDDHDERHPEPDFHNVAPRTREERLAANDKDALEKMRLDHRRGGHNRFDGSKNPLLPEPNSLSFMSEADRFGTDAAAEEYDRRQRKLLEKEEFYEKRRAMSYQREETRWAKIEMEHRYHEEQNAELMASDKAKRNASSVAYNPLTLEYNDSYNGELLKYKCLKREICPWHKDDQVKYKAAQRAKDLGDRKMSQDYDLITGLPVVSRVRLPPQPLEPEKPAEVVNSVGPMRMDLAYGENLVG